MVELRVNKSIKMARMLLESRCYGPSIVSSVTAIELIIRHLLIRPLIQGALLPGEWAKILSERIISGRVANDRKILPSILRHWGIDITSMKTKKGENLWSKMISETWPKRNSYVHEASKVTEEEAANALEHASRFLEIVRNIGRKVGLDGDGRWCNVKKFRESPFKE